jgi:hypothetical protein
LADFLAMFGDLFGNRFQQKAKLGLKMPNKFAKFCQIARQKIGNLLRQGTPCPE